jgi:putative oxidoreductase
MSTATLAERIAYGRPLDVHSERARVQVEPRAGTALAGRILLSAIFFASGAAKLLDAPASIGYMQSVGIQNADALVYVAAIAEILGALSIATGFLARIGALGLIAFLAVTSFFFHDFWNLTGEEQQMQMINFLKNASICGGLLLLFAYGPGRYSIDDKLRRPMQP